MHIKYTLINRNERKFKGYSPVAISSAEKQFPEDPAKSKRRNLMNEDEGRNGPLFLIIILYGL